MGLHQCWIESTTKYMGESSGLGHVYINSANLSIVLWCACAYVHTHRGHTRASLHVDLKEGVVIFFA